MASKQKTLSDTDAFRLIGERLKAGVNRPNIHRYSPHAKQIKFHSSAARRKLYIGGNRSGKTTGGIVEDLYWARGQHPYRKVPEPPVRGRYVTVSITEGIEKIALPEISRWCPPSLLINGSWSDSYDKSLRTLNFANGSFIEFMSYDQDLEKFAGTSRHFTHYDEEPPKDIFTECNLRLLDVAGSWWMTMTPVEGMTWVYDDVYEPGLKGSDPTILVVEIDTHENPYLSQSEIDFVAQGLDEDEKKARIEGKFVHVGGLIYKMFHVNSHVLKEPVDVSKIINWEWYGSLDHGFNNPTAWLWHAVSPDGRVVTFDEHYQSGHTIDYHAKQVHQFNLEHTRPPNVYIGDPSVRNTDPITGTSIQEEYIKYGIPLVLGNNDVRGGISRMARYLTVDGSGRPNWMISPKCVNFIREIQRYRWRTHVNRKIADRSNPMEEPLKKDDHTLDSARYFIMSRPDLTPHMEVPLGQTVQGMMNAQQPFGENITPKLLADRKRTDWSSEYGEFSDDELGGEW
jgi:phage terminase large subunit-like protein